MEFSGRFKSKISFAENFGNFCFRKHNVAPFSYVFTLHYPRVLHCRIVPIQNLKKLFVLGRKKPPIIVVLSEFKRSNLKVTRKFAKTPRGLLDRGVNIFTKRLFAATARPQQPTKYIIFIVFL